MTTNEKTANEKANAMEHDEIRMAATELRALARIIYATVYSLAKNTEPDNPVGDAIAYRLSNAVDEIADQIDTTVDKLEQE